MWCHCDPEVRAPTPVLILGSQNPNTGLLTLTHVVKTHQALSDFPESETGNSGRNPKIHTNALSLGLVLVALPIVGKVFHRTNRPTQENEWDRFPALSYLCCTKAMCVGQCSKHNKSMQKPWWEKARSCPTLPSGKRHQTLTTRCRG